MKIPFITFKSSYTIKGGTIPLIRFIRPKNIRLERGFKFKLYSYNYVHATGSCDDNWLD